MRAPYSVEFIVRGPLDRSVVQRIEMTLGDEDYRLNRRDEPSFDKKLLTDYLKSGSSGTLFGALYHSSSGLDSTMLLDFDLHIYCSPGPRETLTPDMKAEVERIAALVHEILVPHVETDRLTITVYEQSGSANPWDSAEAKTRPWRPSN